MNASPGPGAMDPAEGQVSFVDGMKDAGRRLHSRAQRQCDRVQDKFESVMHSLGPNGRKALKFAIMAAFAYYLRKLGQRYARLVTVGTATVVPIYETFKALESSDGGKHRKWLTYWICLGTYGSLEPLLDRLLGWLPSYAVVKLAVLLWLQRSGSLVVYALSIRKGLKRVEGRADSLLEQASQQVGQGIEDVRAGVRRAEERMKEMLETETKRLGISR